MSIELVRWRDSHFSYEEAEWSEDYVIETVGWVTEQPDWLRLEAERTPDGARMILRIPRVNVISRTTLREVPVTVTAFDELDALPAIREVT